MNGTEIDRFRSFAERYVIERASRFEGPDPRKDAWQAVQDAVSIYKHIAEVGQAKFGFSGGAAEAVTQAQPANHPYGHPGGQVRPKPSTGRVQSTQQEQKLVGDCIQAIVEGGGKPEQSLIKKFWTLTDQLKGAAIHGKTK